LPFTRPCAWGVDLTGGSVRAVQVERRGSTFHVLDVVDQPISPQGEGAEPLVGHLHESVGRALADLRIARGSTLLDPLFVAMPVFGSKHGRLEVPGDDAGRVTTLFDYELHLALRGTRDPWVVRTTAPQRSGQGGLAVEFHAHRRELVQTLVADVRRFGLPIDALLPAPLALARYAELEWPIKGRRLVLEMNRTATTLVYLSERGPRWRCLPFGCGTLDEPEPGVKPPQSEIERLAAQVVREHQTAHRALFGAHDGTTLERVLLLGDAARHDELRRALQERFSVELLIPHAPRHVVVRERAVRGSGHHVLHYGTPLGLAIAALSKDGAQDSLVAVPSARRELRRLPTLSAALLILSLGLFSTRLLADREVGRLDGELERAKKQVRWSARSDFNEARDGALAAAQESQRLLDGAAGLRRALEFPSRLLQALSDPARFFRLVEFDLEPRDGEDEASFVVEVDQGLAGAAEGVRSFLEKRAGVTVTQVETREGEHGTLLVTLRAVVHAKEAGP